MTASFRETLHPGWGQTFEVGDILFELDTGHQHLLIFENPLFGRVMALDGAVQTTSRDEFVYHETLTHVPMFSHPDPKRVLIIGGGDGGILREVVKHPGLEQVTQVEIDAAVIDLCKQYFPAHSDGAFDHPKAHIVIGDGIEFVNTTDERFDIILSDSTDPMGPGEVLFTERFYQGVARCLNPGGIFAAQNGVPFLQLEEARNAHQRLGQLFADASFFMAAVPTYVGGAMALAWASDDPAIREQLSLDAVSQRYRATAMQTRYYNPAIHMAAFALPQYLQDACDQAS
ncbi:MAG: polyamine aminopropyltransferase [Gammaproteobacteria bacterium]|nr:MAG: polyamine aminopropyltransferase [Gammaproteobacteria bacterium]